MELEGGGEYYQQNNIPDISTGDFDLEEFYDPDDGEPDDDSNVYGDEDPSLSQNNYLSQNKLLLEQLTMQKTMSRGANFVSTGSARSTGSPSNNNFGSKNHYYSTTSHDQDDEEEDDHDQDQGYNMMNGSCGDMSGSGNGDGDEDDADNDMMGAPEMNEFEEDYSAEEDHEQQQLHQDRQFLNQHHQNYYDNEGDDGNGEGDNDNYGGYQDQDSEEDTQPQRNNNYEEDEEEDYPDTSQFCEAQFDEGYLEDDEEARGLPPPPSRGAYEDGEEQYNGEGANKSRITTNASGIRIVESSQVIESEEDDEYSEQQEYNQYKNYRDIQRMPPKATPLSWKGPRMNKPRKIRPEHAAAQAILEQLQSGTYSDFKPNILARKLMGMPSHNVLSSRPPPLVKKPAQTQSQQQIKTSPITLESILRQQQRTSSSSMPRLQQKLQSSLLPNRNQLKIKTSHGIPPQKFAFGNRNGLQQQQRQQQQRFPKFQAPQPQASSSTSRILSHQLTSSSFHPQSSLSLTRKPKVQQNNYQYQQISSAQLRSNGVNVTKMNGNPSKTLSNRLSLAAVQLQLKQRNGLQLKPMKNVPRCPICNRTFATNQVLQRHMTLHGPSATITESEGGEYKCEVCFQEFVNPFLLAKHMQSHSMNGNNTISVNMNSVAANVSASSSDLAAAGVHRCRVCYRTFTCLDSLKAHSLMHDGEFKCRACRRGFPDWNTLEEHEATHKRYNCNWCEKYFMNSGNLKAHERIHTGERPYKCSDCPKAFKQLGGLQYHLKTNPNHRPQKYHKADLDAAGEDGTAGYDGGMAYEEDEEYRDYGEAPELSLNDMIPGLVGF